MSKLIRTLPDHEEKSWPKGLAYIVGNEGCERFSYYGMNAILYIYVVFLYVSHHVEESQANDMATVAVHFFKTGVYAFPMIGAILADKLLGKYRTIMWLSLLYCAGHFVLSLTEGSTTGLYVGLLFIAVGSGGIKPCVSAHVGDQFGRSNWYLIDRVYQFFYFMINFGSFFSTLLIPLTQEWFGWSVAFAIPGVLMLVATFMFWLGRHEYVHIEAKPGGQLGALDTASSILLFMTVGSMFFTESQPMWVVVTVSMMCLVSGLWLFVVRQRIEQDDGFLAVTLFGAKAWMQERVLAIFYTPVYAVEGRQDNYVGGTGTLPERSVRSILEDKFSKEAVDGTVSVMRIFSVFFFISIFWALFDQGSSSWIRQADMMNRFVYLPFFGRVEILSSQIQAINPIMVMILIPILTYGVYPFIARFVKLTPLRKMTAGMFLAAFSFVAVAMIQARIDQGKGLGQAVHVGWQMIPYLIITISEVLVSITGLEFAYTQAPVRMKSTVMGFWLLTVSFGNVLVALIAHFSGLALVNFFWLFAALMAVAGILFGLRARGYVSQDYMQ